MKLQIKCKICGYLCPSFQFLGLHLKKHKILSKDYYDTYMKEIGEGYCVVCGKKTKFKTLEIGYRLHCGNSCGTKDKNTQKLKKETNKNRHGCENFNNRPKIEQSIKKHWGDNPWFLFSNKEWKKHCDDLLASSISNCTEQEKQQILDKRKITLDSKTKEEKQESIKKHHSTMLKNHGGKTTMESKKT